METDTDKEVKAETAPEDTDKEPKKNESEGLGTLSEIEKQGPCKRRIKATVPLKTVKEHLD